MSYNRIELDPEILQRVSEADVAAWLVARLSQCREAHELVPIHNLNVAVRRFGGEWDISWGGHAGSGACAVSCPSSGDAYEQLKRQLLDNPQAQAKAKREQAARLLAEVQVLEALAQKEVP